MYTSRCICSYRHGKSLLTCRTWPEPKSDEDYVATANPFAKRKRDTEKNGANTDEADTDGAAKPSAMRKRKRGTEKDGVDADDAVADDTGDLFSNAGTDDAADANGN